MIVKGTRASVKDQKPTFRASQLKCSFEHLIAVFKINDKRVKVKMHLSRNGTTYYPDINCKWVGPLPRVGKPKKFEICEIHI